MSKRNGMDSFPEYIAQRLWKIQLKLKEIIVCILAEKNGYFDVSIPFDNKLSHSKEILLLLSNIFQDYLD